MKIETLETLWNQQSVGGATLPVAALTRQMKTDVRAAERRIRGGIILVGVIIALELVVTTAAHLLGIKRLTPMAIVAEVTFLALYGLFLARAASSARAVRRELSALGGTLQESAEATLRAVDMQIENVRIAAAAIPAVIAIVAILTGAKYMAGEMRAGAAVFTVAFVAALGVAIGAAIWHRYRSHLLPRRGELRELLSTLAAPDRFSGTTD